jgi:hypothetical protein
MPANFMPTDISAGQVLGIRKNADDVETVVAFRIIRPATDSAVVIHASVGRHAARLPR